MNDKYRPNNIVVPITHIPINQVEDNVHNNYKSNMNDGQAETNIHSNYDSNIVYDEQVKMNVHSSHDSDIMYKDEEAFIKSRFINYEVMIPISASTEDISTDDQVSACSNSNEEKQEDLHQNITVNDDKTSEPDVDLSFLDEIDVDLIITYLKEIALIEKSKNKETPPESLPLEKDNITKNEKKSIRREPKYVPPSNKKNVKINLDKDNNTKNYKFSTKKELKYVPPSKIKNLKTNVTRNKTSYTKESVIKLLKHMRQQYETDVKVSKIQPSYVSRQPDVVNRRKTSMTNKTRLNEIEDMKERSKLQQNIHKGAKQHGNKRNVKLESTKSSEIRRIDNNCDKKLKQITKNKHLKSKQSFVEASNTHLQYDSVMRTKLSASQSSTSSKYREIKHERIVKIIDEKCRNKESNVPRSSNSNYANATSNPSISRNKILKAKERMKQYIKLKEQGFFNIKSHNQVKTLKEQYEGLQDTCNIQSRYYLTNVESLKQTTGNVDKEHASFNEQTKKIVPNIKNSTKNREDKKLIESKFDNKANQNKPKTNTDITINDSYKISGDELIELLSKIKAPNQKSFNGSNQQVHSKLLNKQNSNCVKTNGGKRGTLTEENHVEPYISKQTSQDYTSGILASTQMIPTKSQNKKVCDEDTHNKAKYKTVNSICKRNSTEQQTNELRKKSQHKHASMNTIYSNGNKSDNIAQILVEKHNNNKINTIKKQKHAQKENNIKSQGGNDLLTCDQNRNNKSTKNQQTNSNHHTENTNKIMEEKSKFESLKHIHAISLVSAQKTISKLSNIKSNNNNTQTLINKTNKSENMKSIKQETITIEHNVMQNVLIKSINEKLEQNIVLNEKDEKLVIQDLRNKMQIKHALNTKSKSSANVKTSDKDNRGNILIKDTKVENTNSNCNESDIQSNKQNNMQSIEHVNRIKDIKPKLEDQRKEIKYAENVKLYVKSKGFVYQSNIKSCNENLSNKHKNDMAKLQTVSSSEQRSESLTSIQNDNIKTSNTSLNEEAKNYNKTKCFATQSNVKRNNENKYGSEQKIENSNASQKKINVENAEVKQQKNVTLASSEKINITSNTSTTNNKKFQKNDKNVIETNERNTVLNQKMEKLKPHDKNIIDCKDRIHKKIPYKNNSGTLVKDPTAKTNNVTQCATKIIEQNKIFNARTLVKESTAKTNNVTQSTTNSGTLVKEPTAKSNNVTPSATKIIEQNKNSNVGTLVKESTAKTNKVTQSATKIIEENKSNNSEKSVKEPTEKTNNVTQSATKIIEENKSNNSEKSVKEPTEKTNNVTQSATKIIERNKNNISETLVKEPTAKSNNVTQNATKIIENKNTNAETLVKESTEKTNVLQSTTNSGTLVKEPTAKSNNVTPSATKIIEQNKNSNAGTLVKESTAKTNKVTQSATKIIEENKNNNSGTSVKEPTEKTNNVTQSATKIIEENKNNNSGTSVKEPTEKTNNVTQSATKIIEENKNNNSGTSVKEPTEKTNNVTQSATKIIEQNNNSNAGTLLKEPTAKSNNVTQSATNISEQNKNNNSVTLVKDPTAKTNKVTQSAIKIIQQNKNNNAGALVKESTAKSNNVTESATKIIKRNKNSNAGTLLKEPTAKTNNVTQSATKIIEQNNNSNAGTLRKEPTAKSNNVTQSATNISEQNKNNNSVTLVKDPTAKTNKVTQSAIKIIQQNKNNNAGALVKEPTVKSNNVTQSKTKIIEQNTELNIHKVESTKTILNVNGKSDTKISTKSNNDKYKEQTKINVNDKVSTKVAQTSDSIKTKSDIEIFTLQDNYSKSNNQESINQINTRKTDSKKVPYNPLKQSIVSTYFRVANKLIKNYKTYSHPAQNAIELNISVHLGIYCKVSIIHDGCWSRIHKLHINNTTDYMVVKQMRAQFTGYPNKGYEKECILKDLQDSCTLQEASNLLKVFNGFQFNGTWCHVMEYYPLNLTEALWIERDGGLDICQILHLSKQLIGAVKTLKKHRIIHSDIQPNHILMNSSRSTLKLCGFDNAHYEKDSIPCRYLTGAKSYRAPEIILQTSENYSIDSWAAACILFEITTKRPLFKCTLDTFAQQMSLLFNWNQVNATNFDKMCKLHNEKFSNYEFQGPQSAILQRDVTSYMIEGYKQVHTYTIPSKDLFRLRKFGDIVTKMLVLNPRKRLPIESVFFKLLTIT